MVQKSSTSGGELRWQVRSTSARRAGAGIEPSKKYSPDGPIRSERKLFTIGLTKRNALRFFETLRASGTRCVAQ